MYAIFYALQKMSHLLQDVRFTIRTDHENLRYFNENTPKVVRWKLVIQEYDFVVEHIPGVENVVADTLSRLVVDVRDSDVDNKVSFPSKDTL